MRQLHLRLLLPLALAAFPEGLAAQSKLLTTAQPIPGQWIVVMQNSATPTDVDNLANATATDYSGTLLFQYDTAIKGFAIAMPQSAALLVSQNAAVQYVIPDQVTTLDATQTAPVPFPWGLDRIDQRDAFLNNSYSYNSAGAGVNVYIIDTGILTTHQEFAGRAALAADFIGGATQDCNGHGTHVAGIVGGTNYGVAKRVNLLGVRVLSCSGVGTASTLIEGVNWVAKNHANPAVANISIGTAPYAPLNAAITTTIAAGVTFVVAAGNENVDASGSSPANCPGVITVASSSSTDTRAPDSNFGPSVSLFAPGVDITSAYIGSNTATAILSGTSMAAPHVAGAVARYLETHPSSFPALVKAAITSQATPLRISNPGAGSPNLLLYVDPGADSLWSTGDNPDGELGTGATVPALSRAPIPGTALPPLMDISGGIKSGLGLAWDGTVWAWGSDGLGHASPIPHQMPSPSGGNLTGIVAIEGRSEGGGFALGFDGTTYAWGPNTGDLGIPVIADQPVPVALGLKNIVSLSSVDLGTSDSHALAVTADGNVWAWGSNFRGELGNPIGSSTSTPVPVQGLTGFFVGVSAGPYFSLALRADGTVWAWGYNNSHQLGAATGQTSINGLTFTGTSVPVQVGGAGFGIVQIAAGVEHALALDSNGNVWMWGDDTVNPVSPLPTLVPGLTHIVAIAAGEGYSVAVKDDGTVWGWGTNDDGQLGLEGIKATATAVQLEGLPSARLARTPLGFRSHMLASSGANSAVILLPGSLNFGNSQVGSPAQNLVVTVVNSGSVPVTIESARATGTGFTANAACTGVTIAPNQTCELTVTFAPQTAGPVAATLEIVDSSPESPESLALTGTGVLTAAAVRSLTLAPSVLIGGPGVAGTSLATVTLSQPAVSPVVVSLASDSAQAIVPATVTVPAGLSSATFSITTTVVAKSLLATITATAAGPGVSSVLTIEPPAGTLAGFTITPNRVTGGSNAAIGTVWLTAPAQIVPVVVTISSNSPDALVPATVTVYPGSDQETFNINAVLTASPSVTASIKASVGATVLPLQTLTIVPPITLTPTNLVGGAKAVGTLNIDGVAAAAGTVVALASNAPSVIVPATATVLSGQSTIAFLVATTPVGAVTVATITATYPGGRTVTATLTVNPPPLTGLTIAPADIVGGYTATGSLTISSAAPAGGVAVALASSSAFAVVPATVTVPAGLSTVTFTVTSRLVTATTAVVATATLAGLITQAALTLEPVRMTGFAVTPATATGGTPVTGTVTLATLAPAGGVVIALSSNSKSATVPATVTVPAGLASVSFTITTTSVTVATAVAFTATLNGTIAQAPLTLEPPPPYSASGRLTASAGNGWAGITMVFTGGAKPPASVVTDANGNWSQTGFIPGTTYTVIPSLPNCGVTPLTFTGPSTTLNFSVNVCGR